MPSHLRPIESGPTPTASPSPSPGTSPAARFTPGPASHVEGAGPRRFASTGHRPKHRWSAILFAVAIAAVAIAFLWLFVLPSVDFDGPVGAPPAGDQSSSVTADGGTWNLASDLGTPVELAGVSEGGVAIRFLPDPDYAFITLHVVSCKVNGEAHDPSRSDDPIRYTVVNESTGESIPTIDPYFITSGTGEGSSGTVVIVKVEGLGTDQYDSVVLGLDETFAEGDVTTGDYSTTDATDLTVTVTKAS